MLDPIFYIFNVSISLFTIRGRGVCSISWRLFEYFKSFLSNSLLRATLFINLFGFFKWFSVNLFFQTTFKWKLHKSCPELLSPEFSALRLYTKNFYFQENHSPPSHHHHLQNLFCTGFHVFLFRRVLVYIICVKRNALKLQSKKKMGGHASIISL